MPHCPELLLPQAHSLPAFLASDSMFIASIGRDHCHALLPRHLIGRARSYNISEWKCSREGRLEPLALVWYEMRS